jgi:hypothetical protein
MCIRYDPAGRLLMIEIEQSTKARRSFLKEKTEELLFCLPPLAADTLCGKGRQTE